MVPLLDDDHDSPRRTSLRDIETVLIRGFFTCDPSQPRIVYSCSFTEERDPSTFRVVTRAESDLQDDTGDIRNKKLPSSAKALTRNSVKGKKISREEDELLVRLKTKGLSWWILRSAFQDGRKATTIPFPRVCFLHIVEDNHQPQLCRKRRSFCSDIYFDKKNTWPKTSPFPLLEAVSDEPEEVIGSIRDPLKL
jgi:hypothetical protein